MAIPSQSNKSVGTIPFPVSSDSFPSSSFRVGISSSYVTVNTSGAAVTVNFQSDTFLETADNGIWDDTQQCWISVDVTSLRGSRRKNY